MNQTTVVPAPWVLLVTVILLIVTIGKGIELAMAGIASVPQQTNIQGKVTDAVGDPIMDGVHSAQFALYLASSGGTSIWSEGPLNVSTTGGLFNHILGGSTPLPLNLEDRDSLWLQITFDGVVQSPRILLHSVPLANVAGALEVRSPNGNFSAIETDRQNHELSMYGVSGLEKVRLNGLDYGSLALGGAAVELAANNENLVGPYLNFNPGVGLQGVFLGGGTGVFPPTLSMTNSAGLNTVVINATQTGNQAVVLPNGSISALEMADEPGVASNTSNDSITLDGTVQTLLSRTLTAPSEGYVLVIATAEVQLAHVNGILSAADFGASSTAGSLPDNQRVSIVVSNTTPNGTQTHVVTVHGLFATPGGPDDFYFLGDRTSGEFSLQELQMTLIYFPTAYGTIVSTTATSSDEPLYDKHTDAGSETPESTGERTQTLAYGASTADFEHEMALFRAEMEARVLHLEESLRQRQSDSEAKE
jgi:hypothetical protein